RSGRMRGAPGNASVLTPLEHPSSVSALRADPPSPTRGRREGGAVSTSQLPFLAPIASQTSAKLRGARKHRQEISSPYLHLEPARRIGLLRPAPGGRPCPDPANWHWSGGADVQRSHRQHWRM
ncbi:hypothetical protein EN753_35170, partial [Mesorhizobium sp. M2A.F.Ca.ET.029.05.1.1]